MKHWYSHNIISTLLLPLSLLYYVITKLRRFMYLKGLLKQYKSPIPIIVVGNITVGGTGKTPCVIYLAKQLQQQDYKPAIVSRGYGGRAPHYPHRVTSASKTTEVGDEALLMHLQTNMPVVIDPKRARAVQYVFENTDANIILSDDGLQHYAMARDYEIIIIDGQRGLGNQLCLPSGPLRETVKRLAKADQIIYREQGDKQSILTLMPTRFVNIKDEQHKALTHFENCKVHAVCAIGYPERFYQSLQQMGIEVITHTFKDHHQYSAKDLLFNDNLPIIMTHKDAVKCLDFNMSNIWYLDTETLIEPRPILPKF